MSYSDEMADTVFDETLKDTPRYGTVDPSQYSASTIPATAPRTAFNPFPEAVRRPAEPEPGTVIGFAKVFREGGQTYSFAAIRATDRHTGWYLTGPQYSGKAYTWDALLDFIGGPAEWLRIGAVKSWTPLGDL